MDHQGRIARARAGLRSAGVDALLVTNLTNVRYLTGFSGTNGQALVTDTGAHFFSDVRYEARANQLVEAADVRIYRLRLTELLGDFLRAADIGRLGIEAGSTTLEQRDELAAGLDGIELVPVKAAIEQLRRAKDDDELRLIRQAAELAEQTFRWLLDRLAVGATERDVALELEVNIRRSGADDVSFDPIVGSGPLSAHIHHTPSERALEKGDLVLLDFGCRIEGYCSDLTRTVVLGPATDEQRELYDTVLRAQRSGIDAVAPLAACREVDAAARGLIEDAGWGDRFGHGLGHGVGLEIHEAPRFNRESTESLVRRDVVTIEPGIYEPSVGGIRIEDCVVVIADGAEVLGSAPKEDLIEL